VNRKAIWFRRVIKAKQLFDSAIIFLGAPIVNSDDQKMDTSRVVF
jgi:hypothetical protein